VAELAAALTGLAGLVGALVSAYRLLRPSPPEEEEPAVRPEDEHRYDHVSDTHDPGDVAVINELRSALAESRHTVHALRKRLDLAMGIDTSEEPQRQIDPPKQDWLSGS
jgi:hypothetical protein